MNLKDSSISPLVTFFVVTYNQDKYVRQALQSALAQRYRPIEFIFSDDCSTDSTFEIVCEFAEENKHENIKIIRNETNLGVVNHLNKIFSGMTTGQYMLGLAGDDISSEDRTEKIVECFMKTGASAVAVNPVLIDSKGDMNGKRFFDDFPVGILNFHEYFVKGAPFFGGGGYSKEIFEKFGPMSNSARNEDVILPCRASTLAGIAYIDDAVYYYREHGENLSFWVKKRADPANFMKYEIESRRNYLQNLYNFKNEIIEAYYETDKEIVLSEIGKKINRQENEIKLFSGGFYSRLQLFLKQYNKINNSKELIHILAILISPRIYMTTKDALIKFLKKRL